MYRLNLDGVINTKTTTLKIAYTHLITKLRNSAVVLRLSYFKM